MNWTSFCFFLLHFAGEKSFACTLVNPFHHLSAGLIDSPTECVGLGILAPLPHVLPSAFQWLHYQEEIELECLEGDGLLNVFPPSPFLWDPLWTLPVFPAQPPPEERAEQEGSDSQPGRSSAEGALSQNCTQCIECILFLGFCIWEKRRRRSRHGLI